MREFPLILKHNFSFDPTYGYTAKDLLKVTSPETEPTDFKDFWENTFKQAKSVKLNLKRKPLVSPHPQYEFEIWEFESLGGFKIGAWYVKPIGCDSTGLKIMAHGYGGRSAPLYKGKLPTLYPCMPGFNLSEQVGIPSLAEKHVVFGIENKANYLIRYCVAALWASATALLSVHPDARKELYFEGHSFGGGLGSLMLPWDNRFKRAILVVPTFGHHPIRLTCACIGSGEGVRRYYQLNTAVIEVIKYFDAATSAKYLTLPVLFGPALFDPAVPPPGQFAVVNSMPGPKKTYIFTAGHFDYSGLVEETASFESLSDDWENSNLKPWLSEPSLVWGGKAR